jgi:uncharacterized protein (TIGR03066 family)
MNPVRTFLAVGALLLLFTPIFAQEKTADLLIGRWEGKGKEGDKEITLVLEFTKDNKMRMSWEGATAEGTYKLNSETEIEITVSYMGETTTGKSTVTVDKEALTIKPLVRGGKEAKYKRLK